MAGIGFELKKVFDKKGVLNMIKGYAISGVVVTGPMFLSIALLIGIRMIYDNFGIKMTPDRKMLNTVITYTTMFSVVWVNTFSIVIIRYVSDVLYDNKYEKVMPSFYGSITLLLVFGELLYGAFLNLMHIPVKAQLPAEILFGVYVVVWLQINYLSSIKNYKGILIAFTFAVVLSLIVGYLILKLLKGDVSYAVIYAVIFAYSVLAVCNHLMLIQFFPKGQGSMFSFLRIFDSHWNLFLTGLFMQIGLYGHIITMWISPAGNEVTMGLRQCDIYDVPSMMAFLTGVITMINIVISLEVNVYPYFSRFLKLLEKGSIGDIKNAEHHMKYTLYDEIYYCVAKQFFITLACIVFGSMILRSSLFRMGEDMIGIFRVLCVGYGMYACGYAIVLVMFYLNYQMVYVVMALFAVSAIVLTGIFARGNESLFGVGFVIAGAVLFISAFTCMQLYMKDVLMRIFVNQQMAKENKGLLTRLAKRSEELMTVSKQEKEA